ncbi:FG-GAP repeat domain-containing protein [Nocardioides humilatus]|nr:VCBS repeat-containing protein [Nocardioides humilatus]
MRKTPLSLSVLVAGGALVAAAVPAQAAGAWFAPYVGTTIDNGIGPGPAPRGSTVADFNSDGRPDIVTITDFTQGDILLVTGDGDGTFTPAGEIAGTAGTQGLDAGDINGDGKADVVAMSTNTLKVAYGDGAGHFTAGPSYPLTLGGQVEPRLLDLDGDGDLDVASMTFTAINTLINNGSGTFVAGPTTQLNGTCAVSAISPARLNNDTKADLFAVDGCSGSVFALKSTGGGAFSVTGTLYLSGLVPEDIAAIDLNGDGYDDMATIGSFSFTLTTAFTNGQGAFTSTVGTTQFGGAGPTSLTAADFDQDGRKDLAVSWLFSGAPGVTVLAGDGTVKLKKVADFPVGSFPQNPMVADYDLDGQPDIVTAGPGSLSFLRNTTP